MIGLLGLLLAALLDCFKRDKETIATKEDIYHYNYEEEVVDR